jgi:hypothetical protein
MAQMKKLQVYVSSTYSDLQEERNAAFNAILSLGHIPIGLEKFPASDEKSTQIAKRFIDNCDVFVILVGGRYGSVELKSKKSYVELEYDYARRKEIPIIPILLDDHQITRLKKEQKTSERKKTEPTQSGQRRLMAFRKRILVQSMAKFYSKPSDIEVIVANALNDITVRYPNIGWKRATSSSQPVRKNTKIATKKRTKGVDEAPLSTSLDDTIERNTDLIEVTGRALADTPSVMDLLGYDTYVTALANFIESPKTQKPLTIGIDAAWGGGKTTLMRMLEERLRGATTQKWWVKVTQFFETLWRTRKFLINPLRFYTVWFNAWIYDKEETLWAAMALEIWSQTRKRIGFWKRNLLALKLNGKRMDWGSLALDLFKSLIFSSILAALAVLVLAGLSQWLGKDTAETFDWLKSYVKVFASLGIATLLYTIFKDLAGLVLSPFSAGISRYLHQPDYAGKIGFIREFQQDFKLVVESVTQNGKWPLAIFVDDLDRCTPDKAAEVIEAINLLLDSEYCVFIIGMDSSVLSRSIQAKYKEIQPYFDNGDYSSRIGLGRHFLEKIIQIDFRVPQPDKSHIGDFIEYQLGRNLTKEDQSRDQQVAESLIQAEQRVGKTLEEARLVVQENFPDLESVIQDAVESVKIRAFDDHPEVERAIKDMASYLNYNPRRIKRFINMYKLQALIASERNILGKSISLGNLACWVTIGMRWQEFINSAIKDTRIISQIRLDILKLEKIKDKTAAVERIRKSGKYSPDILPLLTDSEFAELLNKITGKAGDAENYFHLSQLSLTA